MAIVPTVLPNAPISTIPQGLLGLLQLKELGQNPPHLLPEVAPNLDLFQFYVQRLLQGEQGLFGGTPVITGLTTKGNFQFAISGVISAVPNNEMWYVDMMCASVAGANIAAADTIVGAVMIQYPNSNGLFSLSQRESDVVNARTRNWCSGPTRQFIAGPGAIFGLMVYDCTSVGGITISLGLRAARLPI